MRPNLRLTGATGIVVGLMFAGVIDAIVPFAPVIGDAQAKVGRPLTPGSVAGVARRTTRRTIRRS
ncbi:hypothetical protein EN803_38780, partial [Mesorhizobium sp. M2D.F.Ca.ET.160.01.1.1]